MRHLRTIVIVVGIYLAGGIALGVLFGSALRLPTGSGESVSLTGGLGLAMGLAVAWWEARRRKTRDSASMASAAATMTDASAAPTPAQAVTNLTPPVGTGEAYVPG